MFSPVHVILPLTDIPPAEAIRASLEPYRRGGKGDVPEAWLAFHDETEHLRTLHRTEFVFTRHERGGTRVEGEPHWLLDIRAVNAEMARRDLGQWRVRFVDAEPDLDTFARSYVGRLERHSVTGGYGRWLNPLRRWDWWDLGGASTGASSANAAGRASAGPDQSRPVRTLVAPPWRTSRTPWPTPSGPARSTSTPGMNSA